MNRQKLADLRESFSRQLQCMLRPNLLKLVPAEFHPDLGQWQALSAYRDLVDRAFTHRPFAPQVSSDVWVRGCYRSSKNLRLFFSVTRRERISSSHHYGHDVQLKRYAGLPLIGRPLPFMLEHGIQLAREHCYERPRPGIRAYLCMGPLRARWLEERFSLPAVPIGPWIAYARPVLTGEDLTLLRQQLGSTLLVVLAHNWDKVDRHMDLQECVRTVERLAVDWQYRTVIWLRHWQDPPLAGLPDSWIVACNGHRSNPWFLDAMRTLLELSDGMASNSFGTHLGYATAIEKRLHWIDVEVEQDLSHLGGSQAKIEEGEWRERRRLSIELRGLMTGASSHASSADAQRAGICDLLNPYWGFNAVQSPAEMRSLVMRWSRS